MHRHSLNNQILIVGAGAFGIALAVSLQSETNEIHFLSRHSHRIDALKQQKEVNIAIKSFQTFEEFDGNLTKFDLIIFAIPTQSLRQVLSLLKIQFEAFKQPGLKLSFISTSKGIEQESIKLPHEIFHDVWGNNMSVAALSGPSFAKEMLLKLPTCLTLASKDEALIQKSIALMHSPHFRLYDSNDIIGVEIGGALKNVIALLAGAVDGLALGHNAKAAVITLGLSDIAHIGVQMGASPLTFMGLSGLGDLILTCTGDLSRNKQFGYRFARGETKEQIIHDMGGVIEGFATTKSAYQLMENLGISSTLLKISYKILYEDLPLQTAMETIINRRQGSEFRWMKDLNHLNF